MIVSEARILANQKNALRSTGPKTEEGKAKSRANALKHGLCSSVVVAEDLALVQRRSMEIFDTLTPQNPMDCWLVDQAAILTIRIDRAQRIERRCRDKSSLRAELTWDDDRRLAAEVLGRTLHKDCAETVESLRKTPHGCDWLMTRWALLAHAADTRKTWTDAQTQLAFDLLATPHVFREGNKPGVTINFDGQVVDPGDDPGAVARREIALLKQRREVVAHFDDVERSLASTDLVNEGDPELRRLRRYESALHSQLRWSLAQIRFKSPHRRAHPSLRPNWVIDPEATPKPEPKSAAEIAAEYWTPAMIHPPFELEPDEYPEPGAKTADIPKILVGRREKRFQKAESRREATRKKAEKLHA